MKEELFINSEINKFMEMKDELRNLISISKNDFMSEESLAQEEEFKSFFQEKCTPYSIDMTCKGSILCFFNRCWIFEYKNRGYILWDKGNENYDYICKVEDILNNLTLSVNFFTE